EVADEVHPASDRSAADVEEVVLRLETVLDQIVELQAADRVPVPDVADAAAVPVRAEVAVVPAGDRALERPLDRHRHGSLDRPHEGLGRHRGRLSRSSWRGFPRMTRRCGWSGSASTSWAATVSPRPPSAMSSRT